LDLRILQALWTLRRIRPEEVHVAATTLLESGVDTPAIARLAGMIHADFFEIEPVMARAFQEGGLGPIDERAARWRLAYESARQILEGEVTPLDGATSLWDLCNELGLPKPLRYFVYLAADYGEGPADRETEAAWFDARIRETARELLALAPSLGESPPLDLNDAE
jgi:hypothetical protein